MPAQSKAQQKFMGAVYALKKGDVKPSDVTPAVRKVAKDMKKSDAKDFASTKHKGLPKKVKQEILNKLKEYANKMGRDRLGGDDYTSKRKGGLRDFDGYDNVDYNKDMPQDESVYEGMFSTIDQIRQDSKDIKDFVKNVFADRDFKDMKNDKEFIKYLKSIYEGIAESKGVPQNYMSGRTSDYHTALRGKNRDYSGGTNFKKSNSGQPDIKDDDEDQETNSLSVKQTKLKEEMGKLSSSERLELYKLYSKAMKAMPGSPNQKKIKVLINKLRKKADLKPLPEYGQRLDLSYLEDEEARLDGTPTPKDAINRDLDEGVMIRMAGKLAQELLPKDVWYRHSSDGNKNREFIKTIVKDLAQTLNKFYKSHNINVRIKENKIELDEIGIFNIKDYVKGIIPSSFFNTTTRDKKEKLTSTLRDLKMTLNKFWKSHNIPYRIK